ncbi:putative membrane protein [Propionispora sp. 2/2-37]|uniref:hypothetical protein n=1 Tax=Propionispora sp. 2/2-37 TaxID=1677858 RepID=UPI0006BB56A4|nr:hypothetical protein [Propionispora sp. 2/2-37]CUH96656.1 putative membrane protein [Propionispora sp. 2/2-37]
MISKIVDQFIQAACLSVKLTTKFFFLGETVIALILTIIVYALNASVLEVPAVKEISQFIVTITANLWAILIAAVVILFPQDGSSKAIGSPDLVARCFKALVALFVCTLVTSGIYFVTTGTAGNSILIYMPIIAGMPILLFFYSLIVVLTITFQVIQEYGEKHLLPQWLFFFFHR